VEGVFGGQRIHEEFLGDRKKAGDLEGSQKEDQRAYFLGVEIGEKFRGVGIKEVDHGNDDQFFEGGEIHGKKFRRSSVDDALVKWLSENGHIRKLSRVKEVKEEICNIFGISE